MTYKIKPERGHFVVYINGKFYCTADNMREAIKEVDNYARERRYKYEIESA
jgi:hypothetical protein